MSPSDSSPIDIEKTQKTTDSDYSKCPQIRCSMDTYMIGKEHKEESLYDKFINFN